MPSKHQPFRLSLKPASFVHTQLWPSMTFIRNNQHSKIQLFLHYLTTFQHLKLFQETGNAVPQSMKHHNRNLEGFVLSVAQHYVKNDFWLRQTSDPTVERYKCGLSFECNRLEPHTNLSIRDKLMHHCNRFGGVRRLFTSQ